MPKIMLRAVPAAVLLPVHLQALYHLHAARASAQQHPDEHLFAPLVQEDPTARSAGL